MRIPIEQLGEHLERMQTRLAREPMPSAFKQCELELRRGMSMNFTRAGTEGYSWPPRKDKLRHPLLILTGELYQSVTNWHGTGAVTVHELRAVTVGVDGGKIPYAAVHQYGSRKRNIPPRPFHDPGKRAKAACGQVIAAAGFEIMKG